MNSFKAALDAKKKGLLLEAAFNTQEVKDAYYTVSDGVYSIEYLITEIQAIPDDVAKEAGIDKKKEIKIFKEIYKLIGKSDLGRWL